MKQDKSDLKNKLSPEQYKVCCEGGTELPFTGKYLHNKETGDYLCVCCQQVLFNSKAKFDSGTGWPSFFEANNPSSVSENRDTKYGMERTEVVCSGCGAHLGHVFNDGPKPTGLRYCINSAALDFRGRV